MGERSTIPHPPTRSGYPRTSDVSRMIRIARANGIDVRRLEVLTDGTIRMTSEVGEAEDDAKRAFDQWNSAGRL